LRVISEFIALLMIVVIAVVSSVLLYTFVGGMISSSRATVKYLEASVSSIEVLHSGSQTYIPDVDYTASYIYKVTVAIHNAGNTKITGITYTTIPTYTLSVCSNRNCNVYDPVAFTTKYVSLPTMLEPNQVATVSFTVLSNVDLLSFGYTPFVIKISGMLPDGSIVTTYVNLFGK